MSDSQATTVAEASATGAEIAPIVDKLEAALANTPRAHALIALMTVLLLVQAPQLTNDQLYEGVKDVSRYVCLWLSGPTDAEGALDKSKLN